MLRMREKFSPPFSPFFSGSGDGHLYGGRPFEQPQIAHLQSSSGPWVKNDLPLASNIWTRLF